MKNRKTVPLMLTFVSLILGFMLALQFQSNQSNTMVESSDFSQLRLNLQRQMDNNKKLEMSIAEAEQLLRQYQSAPHPVNSSQVMVKERDRLRTLAGLSPMEGSGIRIKIEQGFIMNTDQADNIYDEDIRYIVNELFAAGARGISINHHRVTATTYIRNVGDSVYIDTKLIRPPYEILAIGDPVLMESTINLKGFDQYFQTIHWKMTIEKAEQLVLPSFHGEPPIQEMRPLNEKNKNPA